MNLHTYILSGFEHAEVAPLAVALACLLIALVSEWNVILNHLRLRKMSLASVETGHPRLPGSTEIAMTALLTIAFAILFFQFVHRVYAAAFTLSSSSSELDTTEGVMLADFDGDGDLDYLAHNQDPNTVNYYANNGTGTFSNTTTTLNESDGTSVAADIDNDGDMDALIFIDFATDISKLVNNGNGAFTQVTIDSAGGQRGVTGDFNSDGAVDFMLISNIANLTRALYLNDGNGNFSSAASSILNGLGIAAADFNGDGHLDLMIIDMGGNMQTLLNSGTGAFVSSYVTNNALIANGPMAVGDFNGDGSIDVALSDGVTHNLQSWLNNGLSTFFTSPGSNTSNLETIRAISAGDLDNDGDLDIIAGATGSAKGARIYLNDGSGNFIENGSATETSDVVSSLAIGDIDADADLDYIRGNLGAQGSRRYKNDQAATSANTAPVAPSTGFGVTLVSQNTKVTTVDSTGSVGLHTSIVNGTDGYPIISYYDDTNDDLKVVKCGNATCSSGNTTTTVDAGGDVGLHTSMVVGPDNYPIISYYDSTNANLKVAKCGNAACSFDNILTTVDSTGNVGLYTSIVMGTDDLPVISYYNATSTDLKVVKCGNTACSSGNTTTAIAAAHNAGRNNSITMGADGYPVVTHHQATTLDLVLVKCGDASCSSGNSTSTLVGTGVGGYYISSGMGADGLPIISYHNIANTVLRMIKCGNASCSSGNTSTNIGSAGNTAFYNAIALGSDDFPVVAYYDSANADIEVVKCGNAGCTSGNTTTTIEATGDMGTYLSLAIGQDDKPVISYFDADNANLKVAHCGNASCSVGGSDGATLFALAWGSGSDTETSTRLLQYQIKLGTGSGLQDFVSGKTGSPNWVSKLMPNDESRRFLLRNLPCGDTYYWSVASVDTGFKSAWSSEQTFTVEADCDVGSSGGGGGGGGSASTTGGGGGSVLFRQGKPKDGSASALALGILNISAFRDTDMDGTRDTKEKPLVLKGLSVRITGTNRAGMSVDRTEHLDASGRLSISIEESNANGYSIVISNGSADLQGNVATSLLTNENIVVKNGIPSDIAFGFRPARLLNYKPCLTISTTAKETGETDAEKLFSLLTNAYGKSITSDLTLKGDLFSRSDFLLALERTQCFPLVETAEDAEKLLRGASMDVRQFADVPLLPYTEKTRAAYSALLSGLPITRISKNQPVADLASPVSRSEAIELVKAILEYQKLAMPTVTGAVLPDDVPPGDVLESAFFALQSVKVLPESFVPILGPSQGLTKDEATVLLVRAAYAAGKIGLQDVSDGMHAAAPESFMALLPEIKTRACVEYIEERSDRVSFSDVPPGTALFSDVRSLLPFGTRNADDVLLWLLPGTRKLTEFGVRSGQQSFAPDIPVSVTETLRALLIMSCLPPDGIQKNGDRPAGSGESRIARDRISDLPRNETFVSRVLYRSQDHRREYDLSLFTYAPALLMAETRLPSDPFTVSEASELFASALLGIVVMQDSLTPQQAEGTARDLATAVLRQLLGTEVDWRNESLGRNDPLTRRQLVEFLRHVLAPDTSSDHATTQGQAWFERVKAE